MLCCEDQWERAIYSCSMQPPNDGWERAIYGCSMQPSNDDWERAIHDHGMQPPSDKWERAIYEMSHSMQPPSVINLSHVRLTQDKKRVLKLQLVLWAHESTSCCCLVEMNAYSSLVYHLLEVHMLLVLTW